MPLGFCILKNGARHVSDSRTSRVSARQTEHRQPGRIGIRVTQLFFSFYVFAFCLDLCLVDSACVRYCTHGTSCQHVRLRGRGHDRGATARRVPRAPRNGDPQSRARGTGETDGERANLYVVRNQNVSVSSVAPEMDLKCEKASSYVDLRRRYR